MFCRGNNCVFYDADTIDFRIMIPDETITNTEKRKQTYKLEQNCI